MIKYTGEVTLCDVKGKTETDIFNYVIYHNSGHFCKSDFVMMFYSFNPIQTPGAVKVSISIIPASDQVGAVCKGERFMSAL